MSLSITTEWAALQEGSPEECATFSALGISAYDTWLTAGHDRLTQSVRNTAYLSAYHLAEWLAWNWWRLRWEPRKVSAEWELSHSMASIGNGYIWPNIHILSDGKAITLVCKPTRERERTPYRYINDAVSVIPAQAFETEVDRFIHIVLERLQDHHILQSNLLDIWQSVTTERHDPAMYQLRKLEALLGEDPGEIDETLLQSLLDQKDLIGEDALAEIAANRLPDQAIPDVAQLLTIGQAQGIAANQRDQITLADPLPHDLGAAWKRGARAAQLVREHIGLAADTRMTDGLLAELYGAPARLLDASHATASPRLDLSFTMRTSNQGSHVLLRSPWKNSRRFELARLLGDALTHATDDALRPATRADTYRQKVQRAFAAELLSPIGAVRERLNGDHSMESQQDVAQHFQVSDLTIRTLLVNHDILDRSELSEPGAS